VVFLSYGASTYVVESNMSVFSFLRNGFVSVVAKGLTIGIVDTALGIGFLRPSAPYALQLYY
jgi:hypothetical protein